MPEVTGRLRPPRISAAPASPALGELYYDTGTNSLYWWNGTAWIAAAGGGAPPDATASTKGVIQLAGDLAGTATAPSIAAGAIVDADVNAAAAISSTKIAGTATLLWDSVDAGVTLPVGSITTPSLPQTYKHLAVVAHHRSSYGGTGDTLGMRFNGLTTAAYYSEVNRARGSTGTAAENLAVAMGYCGDSACAGSGSSANTSGTSFIILPYYATATGRGYCDYIAFGGSGFNTTTGNLFSSLWYGLYAAGIAISTLTFLFMNSGNFAAGFSRFTVYGLS
jgi:hypothetical protein